MTQLALDDHERNALVCHLDSGRVTELVRGEAAVHAGERCCAAELFASGRRLPMPASGYAADNA